MASNSLGTYHTLVDVAKLHNNKEFLDVAEVLHQKNGLMKVASWEEANQLTSHVYSKEMSLPTGTWRGINEAITPENPQFEQGTEPLGILESSSQIDCALLDHVVPDKNAYRYRYDMQHVEGLGQAATGAFFYGNNGSDPNKPSGIQVRYNNYSLANVHTNGCGDAGTVTSIYVVQFGPGKVNLLYGRNSGAKIVTAEDMDKQWIQSSVSTGAGIWKYVTKFQMVMGVLVPDDRAVQRICNIGTDGADELQADLLIWALRSVPDPDDMSGTVIFCNRLGRYQIDKAFRDRPNMFFTSADQFGQQVETFGGARIVLTEQILNTETVVAS